MAKFFVIIVMLTTLSACLDEADIKIRKDSIHIKILDDSFGSAETWTDYFLAQEYNASDSPVLGKRRPVIFDRDGVVPSACTLENNCRVSAPANRSFLDCAPTEKRGGALLTEFHYDGTQITADELTELLHLYECIGVQYPHRIVDDGATAQSDGGYGYYTLHANDNITPLFVVKDDPNEFVYPWGALYLYYQRNLNEQCPELDPRQWHPQGVVTCP